jgi:hypothetical protein
MWEKIKNTPAKAREKPRRLSSEYAGCFIRNFKAMVR